MCKLFQLIILLLVIFTSNLLLAAESRSKFSLSSGYFYGEGEYSDKERSVLVSVPVALTVSKGLSSIQFSSNYSHFQKQQTNGTKTYNGAGNVYISLKRLVRVGRYLPFIDFQTKFKLPSSATSSELGSKAFGVYVSSSAYFKVSKNWLKTTVFYKWRDDSAFKNTLAASVGFSGKLLQKVSGGITLNYEQPRQRLRSEIIESLFHITWKSSKQLKLTLYYIKGYQDRRLLWANGLQVTYSW